MVAWVVDEIPQLYRILKLQKLRETPGVHFDVVPGEYIPHVDAIDRVIHDHGAISPGPVGNIARPWYMHPDQDDNLLVLQGIRYVEVYSLPHGKIETFEVSPTYVRHNGELICDFPALLTWPRAVFHRIVSDERTGSLSVNLATHYPGFDIQTNFSIYDLDPATGEHRVIREGYLDQFGDL